jgi:ribosomal protein S18 acetylase RimI-like enzyme
MNVEFTRAEPAEIPVIQEISRTIWNLHYPSVISQEQIDYMLSKMYSDDTLLTEMCDEDVEYYLVKDEGKVVGYVAFGPVGEKETVKLHKCYLHPDCHGKGIGQQMLSFVYERCQELGFRKLILAVNKKNEKAIKAYTRFGFDIEQPVVSEIGRGFVMDDYIMSIALGEREKGRG